MRLIMHYGQRYYAVGIQPRLQLESGLMWLRYSLSLRTFYGMGEKYV